MTSDTVRAALGHIWNALETQGCTRALMGDVALATWNHPRATRDIDLLIDIDRKEVDSLVSRLAQAKCRAKKRPPLTVVGDIGFVQLLYTPPGEFYDVQLDLMLAESELQKTALQRRVTRTVLGIDNAIDVLACEDLLLFKLISGRLIDQADSAFLLRENWKHLDDGYLTDWIRRLNLTEAFQHIWREALPGQACPV